MQKIMIKKEYWKDVKDYEGIYQVSNLGRVKSLKFNKEKILKQSLVGDGYCKVNLWKDKGIKNKRVHQLVAIAFLNHKPCGLRLVVNHINFNKIDNRVENLEIVTQRENTNRKHIKSTSKYRGVSWNTSYKKWVSQIRVGGKPKSLGLFNCELAASAAYNNKLKELQQ